MPPHLRSSVGPWERLERLEERFEARESVRSLRLALRALVATSDLSDWNPVDVNEWNNDAFVLAERLHDPVVVNQLWDTRAGDINHRWSVQGDASDYSARVWLAHWIVNEVANGPRAERVNLMWVRYIDEWLKAYAPALLRTSLRGWTTSLLMQRYRTSIDEGLVRYYLKDIALERPDEALDYLQSHPIGDATSLGGYKDLSQRALMRRSEELVMRLFVNGEGEFHVFDFFGEALYDELERIENILNGLTNREAVVERSKWLTLFVTRKVLQNEKLRREVQLVDLVPLYLLNSRIVDEFPPEIDTSWTKVFWETLLGIRGVKGHVGIDLVASIVFVRDLGAEDEAAIDALITQNTRSPRLVSIFERAPRTTKVHFFYRGITQQLDPRVTYPISTTHDLATAVRFMKRTDIPHNARTILVIRVPAGVPMICLEEVGTEHEVVLSSYAYLRPVTDRGQRAAFKEEWDAYREDDALLVTQEVQQSLVYVNYHLDRMGMTSRASVRVWGEPLFVPEDFE